MLVIAKGKPDMIMIHVTDILPVNQFKTNFPPDGPALHYHWAGGFDGTGLAEPIFPAVEMISCLFLPLTTTFIRNVGHGSDNLHLPLGRTFIIQFG